MTRVTLTKSGKPDNAVTGDASAVPANAGTAQPTCGTGRPPSFELVMFFEGSKVPSTVQDINVQPSAGTTPASGEATAGTAGTTETTTQDSPGVTTPPADPADDTATPASTPQGGGAQ